MDSSQSRKRTAESNEIEYGQDDGSNQSIEYILKRRRNNVAVNKTRQKKRNEEVETSKRVQELREENANLERQLESMRRELQLLKEMVVACATGKRAT